MTRIAYIENESKDQEIRNAMVAKKMTGMLGQLSNFQHENDELKTENSRLVVEMQALQSGVEKLDMELKMKVEKASNLEIQLMDTKALRDEIYEESRKIIHSVRLWMREHEKAKTHLQFEVTANNEAVTHLKHQNR